MRTIDTIKASYEAQMRRRIAVLRTADLETCLEQMGQRCDCVLDDEAHDAAADRIRELFREAGKQ